MAKKRDNPAVPFWKIQQREFKQGKPCAICNRKFAHAKMTVDHVIPKAYYEDRYDTSNWQVLCLKCHIQKSKYENYIRAGVSVEPDLIKKYNLTKFYEFWRS